MLHYHNSKSQIPNHKQRVFYSVKRAFSTNWWPGEENTPKIIFFCIFGLLSYGYNIYQVRMEFRKLFDILVHPTAAVAAAAAALWVCNSQ